MSRSGYLECVLFHHSRVILTTALPLIFYLRTGKIREAQQN
jgi:hypothetical protein